jgi:hypothetical protein
LHELVIQVSLVLLFSWFGSINTRLERAIKLSIAVHVRIIDVFGPFDHFKHAWDPCFRK